MKKKILWKTKHQNIIRRVCCSMKKKKKHFLLAYRLNSWLKYSKLYNEVLKKSFNVVCTNEIIQQQSK